MGSSPAPQKDIASFHIELELNLETYTYKVSICFVFLLFWFLFVFMFVCLETESYYVLRASLEVKIFLPLLTKYWDYRYVPEYVDAFSWSLKVF